MMILLQTMLLFIVSVLFFLSSSEAPYVSDPDDPICKKPLDLILIVEEGCRYMDDPKCIRLKQHLIDLTFHFRIGKTGQYARIGVISYDKTPHIQLSLSKGTSISSILHSIESISCADHHSPSANNLMAAIDAGLHEFSSHPRFTLENLITGTKQAMIIYPSCDCSQNGTLCSSNDLNTKYLLQKLAKKDVAVYTSGYLTKSHDYTCLISDSDKESYLFDNPKCDMLPYIHDARILAQLFCPV